MGYLTLIALLLLCAIPALAAPRADLFVSIQGSDAWSGKLAAPNRRHTDGPFASIERAQQAVRALLQSQPARDHPILVQIRGGDYYLNAPLLFTPADSGTAKAPVIYSAYPGERPILSGGTALHGWKVDAQGRWQIALPDVQRGGWNFSQLWVNDQRRFRPRLPKRGYDTIADSLPPSPAAQGKGFDRFQFRPGDIDPNWSNRGDIEALCFQTWTMARLRLADVDADQHIVTFSGHTAGTDSYAALPKGNRYLLENVKEALSEPGEWYLDRPAGLLTYIPLPGEQPEKTVVIAPRLDHLLELRGDPADQRWVSHLTFQGLRFEHTNWNTPLEGNAFAQAEVNIPGAIRATGARDCGFERCAVSHIGTYAVEWGEGCKRDRLEECALTDLGAGGVKIGEMEIRDIDDLVASDNSVRNCLIANGGRLHPAAVGVWIGQSPGNHIDHNTIRDLYYTGISVGWTWGYGRSLAHDNILSNNSISQIGQGVLSDMGGIYTLGISPGSVLRHNQIHNVQSFSYGGWGIYFDEGTTDMLAEDNLVYDTKTGGFHQHYGKDNMVQNNIFALAKEGQIIRTRAEDHRSFSFEHNIVYYREGQLLGSNWDGNNYLLDDNLYWNASGQPVTFAGMNIEQWRQKGQDLHSLIADPRFVDPEHGDFRLRPGSPASQIGFHPIDMNGFGCTLPASEQLSTLNVPRAFPAP